MQIARKPHRLPTPSVEEGGGGLSSLCRIWMLQRPAARAAETLKSWPNCSRCMLCSSDTDLAPGALFAMHYCTYITGLKKNAAWAIERCQIPIEKTRIFKEICEYFAFNFSPIAICSWMDRVFEKFKKKYSKFTSVIYFLRENLALLWCSYVVFPYHGSTGITQRQPRGHVEKWWLTALLFRWNRVGPFNPRRQNGNAGEFIS